MTNIDGKNSLLKVVAEFYRYENSRDRDGVRRLVDPQIVSHTYPGGDCVVGRDEYMATTVEIYRGHSATFDVLSIGADPRTATVHAELVIGGRRFVDVFELRDGLIVAEREYLGEGYDET